MDEKKKTIDIPFDEFQGQFDSFADLWDRASLGRFVVTLLGDDGVKDMVVIGTTELGDGDTLLHLVDAEDIEDITDLDEAMKINGVEFISLNTILAAGGLTIDPNAQIDFYGADDEDE